MSVSVNLYHASFFKCDKIIHDPLWPTFHFLCQIVYRNRSLVLLQKVNDFNAYPSALGNGYIHDAKNRPVRGFVNHFPRREIP